MKMSKNKDEVNSSFMKKLCIITGLTATVGGTTLISLIGLSAFWNKSNIDTILMVTKDKIEQETAPESANARIFKYRRDLFAQVNEQSTFTFVSKERVLSCMKEQVYGLISHLPVDQKEWSEADKEVYKTALGDIKEASAFDNGMDCFRLLSQKMYASLDTSAARQIPEETAKKAVIQASQNTINSTVIRLNQGRDVRNA